MKIRLLSFIMAVTMLFTVLAPSAAMAAKKNKTQSVSATEEDLNFEIEMTSAKSEEKSGTKTDKDGKKDKDGEKDEDGEADDSKEAQLTLEEQQEELEKNLAEVEETLAELEKSSKVKEEYIDTLDHKIDYMNKQLKLLENENKKISKEIDALKPDIEENEKKLAELTDQLEEAQKEYNKLEKRFQSTYDAYCYRLKVMYISGDFNVISALLSCRDLSGFLTRYEMIKTVAKSDTELLRKVNAQMDEITTKKNGIDEKKAEVEKTKAKLDKEKSDLVSKQKSVESNREVIANKKTALAVDRAESDRLLAQLTAQNKQYTEYRNEDEELIAAVEQEIQNLIAGVIKPEEATTVAASDRPDTEEDPLRETDSDVYSKSDAVLNLTYPVPNHRSISAGFPNYSSGRYHGGVDFPCPKGSKVVAAQKGIVITVKRLNYSYGYYVMIYHGTDSAGRSVVTLYAHNSSILVSVGDTVEKGEAIAKSGSTGNSTGPHCHFEVRLNGVRSNPNNFLS